MQGGRGKRARSGVHRGLRADLLDVLRRPLVDELVLQVLGVIDHNLLAAYASNLFGLVCVAFVKIRHVRGFKRKLILEAETSAAPVS